MGMYTALMDDIERALEHARAERQVFVEITPSGRVVLERGVVGRPEPYNRPCDGESNPGRAS